MIFYSPYRCRWCGTGAFHFPVRNGSISGGKQGVSKMVQKKKILRLAFIFVIALLCSACAATSPQPKWTVTMTATQLPAIIPSATVMPSTSIPSFTPTVLKVTKTITPSLSTSPLLPTRMKISTFTLVPITPSVTPKSSSTPTITKTPQIDTPDFSKENYRSPDGKWTAKVFQVFTGVYPYETQIANQGQTVKWTIHITQKDLDQLHLGTRGILRPIYWSKDGLYAIFILAPWGDGGRYFDKGVKTYRLDLTTGQMTDFLSEIKGSIDFTFSPDGSFMAYINEFPSPLVLNILNLQNGSEQRIPINGEFAQAGEIVWSPSQDRVILTVTGYIGTPFSLIQVHLESKDQTVILQDGRQLPNNNEYGLVFASSWSNNGILTLNNRGSAYWSFDLATHQVIPILNVP
jgi:hypothetical protein